MSICQFSLFTQAPPLSTAKAPTFLSSPPRSVRAPGRAASQTPLRILSPWASLLRQTVLWGSTTCMLQWWHPLASVGPERTTAETSTSSSTPGHQVGLGSLIRDSFFVTFYLTFILIISKSCCRSSADAVFLDDETERQECVMNEMGIIYHGAYDDIAERDWNYGQVVEWPIVDIKIEFQRFFFYLSFSPPSLTMESWMPVCISWTRQPCPSLTEETPSRWPERPLLWWESFYGLLSSKTQLVFAWRFHEIQQLQHISKAET